MPRFVKTAIGIPMFSFSFYLWHLASKIADPQAQRVTPQTSEKSVDRSIHLGSGSTYNESLNVQGDYVQGDKYNVFNHFNFDQDASSAVAEIEKLLKQLEKKVSHPETVQQQTIQDLAVLVRHHPKINQVVYDWLKALEIPAPIDEIDAAEKIVAVASKADHHSPQQSFFQLDQRYRRLEYLLKTAQWQEADDETIRVIAKLMPGRVSKHGCTHIDVSQISPKALRTINRLWLEASGGRFGLSVQKRIWQRIKAHQERRSGSYRSDYEMFVEAVGWSNESGRVYHTDFDYLITNPKGHLPMKILLWETYDSSSNYCYLSHCLFDELMEREYSNVSFLPDWLREWLLLD
ncbi:GUN4 domain-containing protein [Leptolyngbya sp. AN03gr2]|uniref:GUN4 domain-containing protein n=1 Tax=unclassified Leptolyngbya TaxID=2650499 RepID=UPI003D312207